MSDPAMKAMSVEEDLRTGERSPCKRECVGGCAYPLRGQAGASEAHTLVGTDFIGTLAHDAMRAGCRLYQNDMKPVADGDSSSPDAMAVCDPHDTARHIPPVRAGGGARGERRGHHPEPGREPPWCPERVNAAWMGADRQFPDGPGRRLRS